MKVKNKKEIKKDEFRKNKKTRHPAYVYAQVGHKFKYLGLTHAEITDNVKNIRLVKNPNPNDTSPAFIRNIPEITSVNDLKVRLPSWKLGKRDKEIVNRIKK